jgi:cytochrome c556
MKKLLMTVAITTLVMGSLASVHADQKKKVEVSETLYKKRAALFVDLVNFYKMRDPAVSEAFSLCYNAVSERAEKLDVPMNGMVEVLKCAAEIEMNVELHVK